MELLEEKLKSYPRIKHYSAPQQEKIDQTIAASKMAFFESESQRTTVFFEFLFEQGAYIKKRWWVLQILVLSVLWGMLVFVESSAHMRRSMGVCAPVFVVLVIPELWKNKSCDTVEIEGVAYYTLRQIYAARMLLFALVDVLLLGIFTGMVSLMTCVTVEELLIQFFIPLSVTCGICFRTLCSRHFGSEYFAVSLSILWCGIWMFIVLREEFYRVVSVPVWLGLLVCSVLYVIYAVYRVLRDCGKECMLEWN